MAQARQTFERRQLGLALRRLREQASKSQQVAADAIGKARTRIVELEDGRATITPDDLAKLLDYYGVADDEQNTVVELAALARKRKWGQVHTDLLPNSFQRFADMEASATEISCYESGVIPGLLQSQGYLRAAMADSDGIWWTASGAELQERIAFRMDRQVRILDSPEPKVLRFVLAESALRGSVGNQEVMREQRRHILNLLESKRNLAVQVLRNETFGNPAPGGGLTVFGFGEKGSPIGFSTVVFGPSTYFDGESDTAALLRAFRRLQELALSPEKSARLIRQIDKEN
jgi:transcriptional regulator with XRE-family HTH domain